MRKIIITEIMSPIMRRGGTALGAYLIGLGVNTDTTTTIVAGLTAFAGVALDLMLSHLNRK